MGSLGSANTSIAWTFSVHVLDHFFPLCYIVDTLGRKPMSKAMIFS